MSLSLWVAWLQQFGTGQQSGRKNNSTRRMSTRKRRTPQYSTLKTRHFEAKRYLKCMPDDPSEGEAKPEKDPKELLREKLERIEREEALRAPDLSAIPSNDEIRAASYNSPIESQIGLDHLDMGSKGEDEENLSEEEKKLREFDERLKAARGSMPAPPEWDYKRTDRGGQNKAEENNYFGMGVGISIAYTLVGATVAGWGIGKLIDMKAGGSMGQAIGTLLGAIIGLAAAVVTIIKAQNKPGN